MGTCQASYGSGLFSAGGFEMKQKYRCQFCIIYITSAFGNCLLIPCL